MKDWGEDKGTKLLKHEDSFESNHTQNDKLFWTYDQDRYVQNNQKITEENGEDAEKMEAKSEITVEGKEN